MIAHAHAWPVPDVPARRDVPADIPADPEQAAYLSARVDAWWDSLPLDIRLAWHVTATVHQVVRNGGEPLPVKRVGLSAVADAP